MWVWDAGGGGMEGCGMRNARQRPAAGGGRGAGHGPPGQGTADRRRDAGHGGMRGNGQPAERRTAAGGEMRVGGTARAGNTTCSPKSRPAKSTHVVY